MNQGTTNREQKKDHHNSIIMSDLRITVVPDHYIRRWTQSEKIVNKVDEKEIISNESHKLRGGGGYLRKP